MITPGSGEIAGQLRRATAQVRSNEGRTGSGSGVVWNRQGQIVSNAPVIRGENVVLAFGNPIGFASRPALGLRIQQMVPGSKAQVASPLPGDVIIGADSNLFSSPHDLFDRLNKGGLMQLKYHRSGKAVPREVATTLGPAAA